MNLRNKFTYIALSAALFCGQMVITGCDNEKELPPYIDATETELVLEDNGLTADGSAATFQLGANDGWKVAYAPEWVHINYESGDRGRITIHVTAEENFTGEERKGVIEFQLNGGKPEQVGVTQKMKAIEMAISTVSIPLSKEGADIFGASPSFTVETNYTWSMVVSEGCDWISADAKSGEPGLTTVKLNISPNTTNSPRKADIVILAGKTEYPIAVRQQGTYTPDGMTAGHVYFTEVFDWAHQIALQFPDKCQDQVGSINGKNGKTLPIYGGGNEQIREIFGSTLIDLNPTGSCLYVADGYIKMGKSSNQTGVCIKNPLDIPEGQMADIELSFSIAKNGTDKVTVSVEIEGDGAMAQGENSILSLPLEPIDNSDKTINWQWKNESVIIEGVTANTRIMIRSTQFGLNSGYYRWFLDNIKVTRIQTSN